MAVIERGDSINTKKFFSAVFILMMIGTLSMTTALAADQTEQNEQISTSSIVEDTAQQIAECADMLNGQEYPTIVLTTQEGCLAAHNEAQEFQKDLSTMLTSSDPAIAAVQAEKWTGPVLTRSMGVNRGPTGKETYYNLNMSGVVKAMRNMGYSEAEYPYWVRSDGVKMFGKYVMAAANLNHFPKGSIVPSSLGLCIVCDTGYLQWDQLDLATQW